MKRTLAFIALLLIPLSYALAGEVTIRFDKGLKGTGGTKISALSLSSTRWTGWINVEGMDKLDLEWTLADSGDSITAVQMRCESAGNAGVANDAGADICSRACGSGTCTYTCPLTYTLTTGTAEHMTWTVDNLPDKYVNCLYTGTGSPSGDTITVDARGRAP